MPTEREKNRFDKEGFLNLEIYNGDGFCLPDRKSFCDLLNEPEKLKLFVNSYNCPISSSQTAGFFVATSPNEFAVFFGNKFSPFVYLGLNKDDKPFIPSSKRYPEEDEEKQLDYCVAWVLKRMFFHTFITTFYATRCEEFQVLNHSFKFDTEAIALHYGFLSDYIEVTPELLIAMFFAYTYVDKKLKYHPIDNFSGYSPTLYVSRISDAFSKLKGFQMLPRPRARRTMAIDVADRERVDRIFTKVELPKSPEIALDIFNKLDHGGALMPYCDIMLEVRISLMESKKLSIGYLGEYCDKKGLDLNEMVSKLAGKGYDLTNGFVDIQSGNFHHIHREIDDTIQYLRRRIGILKEN